MASRSEFMREIQSILSEFDPEVLSYDESEFWMIQSPYEYIEYYAIENQLLNTSIALPLARGLHDGSHRKSSVMRDGQSYRLPYVIHCLLVCRMLVDLHVPLSKKDEDVMLAAALCHDMIEDLDFPHHGKEMYETFHLDKKVYDTVLQVSKRYDFTEQEEKDFFHGIESNKLALLVKLSDRGHNVEDLYNMSFWKVHEYIGETRKFFVPMCDYGLQNYPDLMKTMEILKDKIVSLTNAAEVLVDRFIAKEADMKEKVEALRKENEALRTEWKELLFKERSR